MLPLRKVIPAVCLRWPRSRACRPSMRRRPRTTAAAPAPFAGGRHWHGHHHGVMGFVLHKLNLTAEQKTQIKGIFGRREEPVRGAARERQGESRSARDDRADRARLSGVWSQTGADQRRAAHQARERDLVGRSTQACSPRRSRMRSRGIVAAAKAQREAQDGAWKAQRTQPSAPPTSD